MIFKLKYKFLSFFFCFSDAADAWQIAFQDPATPVVEGMIFFHNLMLFLIVIGFFVMWAISQIADIYSYHSFMLFIKLWGGGKRIIKSPKFRDFLLFFFI